MKTKFIIITILLLCSVLNAQPVRLRLPVQINMPNFNHFAPSVSADGMTMLFSTDNHHINDENRVLMKISYNKGGGENWGTPEELEIVNKSGILNLYGGHSISADGNTIYFTSKKTGGVGGFDIWFTIKKEGKWSVPQNLGKPVNSDVAEGYPSLSPDGKILYFLRCATMSNANCDNCKLYMAEHKGQGFFKEPVEMPAHINASSVMAPRIAKDGKTLTFSSKRPDSKGGYDLYLSRKNGNQWSEPENMDFLNTIEDEKYADFTPQGESIIYSNSWNGYLTIFKAKTPANFQPSRVLLLTGTASTTSKQPIAGYLQISDNSTGQPISISRIDVNGKFTAVLPMGKAYDVAVTSGNNLFFWSQTFDVTQETKSRKEDLEALLPTLEKGTVYHGNKTLFDSTTYRLLPGATLECKRLAKLFQSHAEWKINILIYPSGISNNAPSNPISAYEKMKTALLDELSKTGLPTEQMVFSNGFQTTEEENNYSGWGWMILE